MHHVHAGHWLVVSESWELLSDLCHVPSVCRALEWIGCCIIVLYKESCQSLILPLLRSVWWFDLWMRETLVLLKSTANLPKCMGKVCTRGTRLSNVICLMGEGQMCTMKWSLDVSLLHDNPQSHTAEKMTKLFEKFDSENLDHLLSVFTWHLLTSIYSQKWKFLGRKRMQLMNKSKK